MVARSPVWFNCDSLAVRFSPLVIKVDIFPLEVCHETSGVYRTCFDLIAVFLLRIKESLIGAVRK